MQYFLGLTTGPQVSISTNPWRSQSTSLQKTSQQNGQQQTQKASLTSPSPDSAIYSNKSHKSTLHSQSQYQRSGTSHAGPTSQQQSTYSSASQTQPAGPCSAPPTQQRTSHGSHKSGGSIHEGKANRRCS
ncbi:hypothetical protein N431DRAFT_138200 [Stipitochalara longipes BDJ]|nr:hypothetical protein N431DRAFT_138200 [Stipitochalara longipes BDJ]